MRHYKFNNHEIKLVIFDMDGTLVDSTGIWSDIDKEFFKKRGIDIVPEEYSKEIVHLGLYEGAKMTIEKYNFVNDTVEGLIKEWTDASIDQYLHKIPLKPYAKDLLEFYKSRGLILTLATANDETLYRPCLDRLEITNYFSLITDVNIVKEGKSSPKIYDSIIEKFGVKREETLILEDSLIALTTAFNSGYNVIAVDDLNTANIEKEKRKTSHLFIKSFEEIIEK